MKILRQIIRYFSRPNRSFWKTPIRYNFTLDPRSTAILCLAHATADDGETFQVNCSIPDPNESALLDIKELAKQNLEGSLNQFLDKKCRCRLGRHWKCSIHKNWIH